MKILTTTALALTLATAQCGGNAYTVASSSSGSAMGGSGASSGEAPSSGVAASGQSATSGAMGSSSGAAGSGAMPSSGASSSGAGSSGAGSSGAGSSGTPSSGASTGATGGSGVSASGSAGSGAGASGSTGSTACPANAPTAGSTCLVAGAQCEYGASPNLSCNQLATCASATWSYAAPVMCPTETCPLAYDDITSGGHCDLADLICAYPKGTCNCTSPPSGVVRMDGGRDTTWDCIDATAACKSPRPDIGTPCSEDATTCNYGVCEGDVELECSQGRWQRLSPPCAAL